MFSLLIDTHGSDMNLIIYKNHNLEKLFSQKYNNQSKYLISNISNLLKEVGIKVTDLSEIIVVNGPGSFTGIRIGVTVAKTLSYCLNIPIKSISSIKLMAIGNNCDNDYSISIPDNTGYFIGRFDKNNSLIDDYFYISKSEYEEYKDSNLIIEKDEITWDKVFDNNLLVDEDCYNIKPLYIKKIEVEK